MHYRPAMTPTVRTVREDELQAFVEAMSTAFLEHLAAADVAPELARVWDLSRTWAAFDGERICGTFRSWATELTVPGGARLKGAAVSGVTVQATHRRRGILRSMLAAEHAAIRDRGEVVGLLYASEYPIYGRFGYGPATRQATWTLTTAGLSFHGGGGGSVEIVRPSEAVRDEIAAVFDAWRTGQPGEIWRRPYRWDDELGLRETAWGPHWKGYVALHRDDGGAIDGYVRYRPDQKWVQGQPRSVLEVDELHGLTDAARTALWRLLAETDWVAAVKAERRLPSDRLPWLLANARAADVTDVADGLWVRLFDVARALAARRYERSATLVLEVVDPEAPGSAVRYLLDAGPDGATCRPTDRSADLTVGLAALGAAYLGGTRLSDAVRPTGADEHRTGALADAETLFRTSDDPWCSTFF